MHPTDLTVAAVVVKNGKYLIVQERAMGRIVLSQPGGHIEAGETPEQAVQREVLEESACVVRCKELIGVYLWIHPQTRQQFLRIMYVAEYVSCNEEQALDTPVIARHWLSRAELEARRLEMRSPAVLRCIRDFEAGRREPDRLISQQTSLAKHVDRVMARADLV